MSEAVAALPAITLYGRPGCHLCAEARRLVDQLAPRYGFAVQEVDIDTDARLLARYDIVIPVVALGDRELARAPLSAALLEARLQQAAAALR